MKARKELNDKSTDATEQVKQLNRISSSQSQEAEVLNGECDSFSLSTD